MNRSISVQPNSINFIKDNSVPCNLFKQAQADITKQVTSEEYRIKERRRANGVAQIMNQVVGAEVY